MEQTWKRIGSMILSVCMVLTMLSTMASAASDITANFTDANFLAAVRVALNKGADDPIYDIDVASVKTLDVSSKSISSLAGIEYFTELTSLSCNNNQLTTLNVSKNVALATLRCFNNNMADESAITGLDRSITTTFEFSPQNSDPLATGLAVPSIPQWEWQSDGSLKVSWNPVANAVSYQVKIYMDAATPLVVDPINDTELLIVPPIGAGSYTFTVAAVGDGIVYANSPHSPKSEVIVVAPPSSAAVGSMTIDGVTGKDLASDHTAISWSWVAATATLTLYSNYSGEKIYINCRTTDTINLEYSGPVNIVTYDSSTIYCAGNLVVNGSGSTMQLDYTGSGNGFVALEVYGTLTIQSGTLHTVGGGTGKNPNAAVIYASKGVTITGSANVTVNTTGAISDGIATDGIGEINISTSGSVTANGTGTQYALNAGAIGAAINISSGIVTLNHSNPANLYFGTINHTGGTLNGNPPTGAAPTILKVEASSMDGVYTTGQNIDFKVVFSEPVTVDTSGGTPYIALTVGSATKYAEFVSGNGTDSLVFRYTVQFGDLDFDGITLVSPVGTNGGKIKNAGGMNAVLTFTPPIIPGIWAGGVAPATYTISGTIKGGDTNSGIADAVVRLISSAGGNILATTMTNVAGEYAFFELPAGNYSIEALHEGYYVSDFSNVVVSNANVIGKDLTLRKLVDAVPVSSISITGVVEPVEGASPGKKDATVPDNVIYAIMSSHWVDDEDRTKELADDAKFAAGKKYVCGIRLKLAVGYILAPNVTATINGKTAAVMLTDAGADEFMVYYIFTAKGATDSDNGGNGGGSGSGDSSSGGSTTIPESKPNQPVTASAVVTATAGKGGSISPSGAVTVNHGGNQQFTITPNTGYHIEDVKVDGSSVGAVTSYTFNDVTKSHAITASFAYNDDDNPPDSFYVPDNAIVNNDKRVTVDLTRGSATLSADQIDMLITFNKDNPVVLTGDGYSITFPKGRLKLVGGRKDYDFGICFNAGTNYSTILSITGDGFVKMLDFNHSGELPGEAQICIRIGAQYAGNKLYYYYYNPQTGNLDYIQAATVDVDSYITIKQSRCSSYVFTLYNDSELEDIPKTGDASFAFIWWGVLTVSGAGFSTLVLTKKKALSKR